MARLVAGGFSTPLRPGKVILGEGPGVDIPFCRGLGLAPRHAQLRPFLGGYVLEHLAGTHETTVNGQRVDHLTNLAHGDRLRLGQVELTFVMETPSSPTHPSPINHPASPADARHLGGGASGEFSLRPHAVAVDSRRRKRPLLLHFALPGMMSLLALAAGLLFLHQRETKLAQLPYTPEATQTEAVAKAVTDAPSAPSTAFPKGPATLDALKTIQAMSGAPGPGSRIPAASSSSSLPGAEPSPSPLKLLQQLVPGGIASDALSKGSTGSKQAPGASAEERLKQIQRLENQAFGALRP